MAALATVVEAPGDVTLVGAKLLTDEGGERLAGGTGDEDLDARLAAHARSAFLPTRAEARVYKFDEIIPNEEEDAPTRDARDEPAGTADPSPVARFGLRGAGGGVSSEARERWRGARVLFERLEPEPHVVVCGAGHVGAALARLAHAVGYRVTLVDDRAEFLTRARFGGDGIALVVAEGGWESAVRRAVGRGRGAAVAVVTRGHNEDEECMRAVLAARPDYVGMIGSRRRTNIVLARLREAGFAEEQLREVRAPVGLDLGAVTPEEVALAILAEIVARRRGGTGAPLSAWRRS